jgi:hypothetical protein
MSKKTILSGVFLSMLALACACSATEGVVSPNGFATAPVSSAGIMPCMNTAALVPYGIATLYWAELISPGERTLWLYVNGCWRSSSQPTDSTLASIQDAFSDPDHFQVVVWYANTKIIGLVVRSPMQCG